jgi:D-amino peptidase
VRVFIVSDMEGVAGISNWGQVGPGKGNLYEEGRKLYTEEMNAAIRGAAAAGAKEIVVMDCHGAGGDYTWNSLLADQLDERCEFVVQREWTDYTGFLEEGCDAALFVAMHAMAGAEKGVLSHTVRGTEWRNLWFNGTLVGETGINAALCGTWGVPVLMVTGDDVACAEARNLLGDGLTTVAVKQGLGRYSARHVAPLRARKMIEEGAKQALSDLKAVPPYDPGKPSEIKVELAHTDVTEEFRHKDVEIVDSRTIVARDDDWWTTWQKLFF